MTRVIDPIECEKVLDYCGGYVDVKQAITLYGLSLKFIRKKFKEAELLMAERGIVCHQVKPKIIPLDILKELIPLNEKRIRQSAENQRKIKQQKNALNPE